MSPTCPARLRPRPRPSDSADCRMQVGVQEGDRSESNMEPAAGEPHMAVLDGLVGWTAQHEGARRTDEPPRVPWSWAFTRKAQAALDGTPWLWRHKPRWMAHRGCGEGTTRSTTTPSLHLACECSGRRHQIAPSRCARTKGLMERRGGAAVKPRRFAGGEPTRTGR